MADRIDPQAGWFNIESLDAEKVVNKSRVANPPAAESSQMQPRQSTIVTNRISSASFVPVSNAEAYIRGNNMEYIETNNPDSLVGKFITGLNFVPHGAEILQLRMLTKRKVGANATTKTIIELFRVKDSDLVSSGAIGGFSINDASTSGIQITAVTGSHVADQENYSYFLWVTVNYNSGADVAADERFYWAEIQYHLPG